MTEDKVINEIRSWGIKKTRLTLGILTFIIIYIQLLKYEYCVGDVEAKPGSVGEERRRAGFYT